MRWKVYRMSTLDELIEKFCKDGVDYSRIGSVVEYEQPSNYIVASTDYNDAYSIPVLTAGQSFILGFTDENYGIYNASKDNPVIIFDDFTGSFKWVDFPFKVKSSALKMLTAKSDKVLLRFIYHAMGKIGFSSNEHKRLWISIYSEFIIPVPPLPVQQEIVRILDTFTNLQAELEAELEARRNQYEYYLGKILVDSTENGFTTIENYCQKISSGGTPLASDRDNYDGTIPWLRTQEVVYTDIYDTEIKITEKGMSSSSAKWVPVDSVIIAMYGASAARVAINKIPLTTNQACCNLVPKEKVAYYRYIYYWIVHKYEELKGLSEGAQANLNAEKIRKFPIPLVSFDTQKEIANKIEALDSLVNNILIGLPAEIEARRKQYKYYRNKLLTFKEKVS